MSHTGDEEAGRRRSKRSRNPIKSIGASAVSSGSEGAADRNSGGTPRFPVLSRNFRFFKNFLIKLLKSKFALSFPFVSIFLITSTDFLVLTNFTDAYANLFFTELGARTETAVRDDAEALKTKVARYVYLLVLFLCALNWRVIDSYFRRFPHLILLFAVLLLGCFVSTIPVKVITNVLLTIIGFLTAILFAIANRKNVDAFFLAVLVPTYIIHIASFGIFQLYDVNLAEFLFSQQRYGGLAGNPNSLGGTAVLGYWGALSLLLSRTSSKAWKYFVIFLAMPLFGLHITMSGSGTATVSIILITMILLWLRFLAAFSNRVRYVLNLSGVFVFLACFLAISVYSTPAELYLSFTDSLGKDSTMTGRTVLWEIAREAISLKPVLGWGFDSHTSVQAQPQFDIPFHHYHNGFLDTMISGGVVLLVVVLYNLGKFSKVFLTAFRQNENYFPLVLPLIMLLFLNLSEYSLLRPNSPIWELYVGAFVLLTLSRDDLLASARNVGNRVKTKRRSRRGQFSW